MNTNKEKRNEGPHPTNADLLDRLDALADQVERLRIRRDDDRLLDADEVASLLGVSRRTVSTLTAEGSLPKIKIGRSVRYRRNAINAFVRAQAEGGRR